MQSLKRFSRYVIPSVLSFALSGVYAIVDGLFIGNSIGDIGLSAITVAYPIVALIQALGTGIGLAAAIQYTISGAQGKHEEEKACVSGGMLLLVATGVIATGLFFLLSSSVLHLLGASGGILRLADEYIRIIAIGAVFQVMGTGLIPFVRNMGGAVFSMLSMVAGFLTNIALDYFFVWVYDWGIAGAAWATIIGQGVTMLATLIFLLRKKPGFLLPHLSIYGSILKAAPAPFGLTFSPNIILILMNRFLLSYSGAKAVATYACIAYITSIVYLLLQGIGDGSQPLISHFYGESALRDLKQTRRLAYLTGGAMVVLCMVGLFVGRGSVGTLFGASAEVNADVASILPLFLCGVPFLAFVRITTSYFYATEESRMSYLLVYSEPILLFLLLLVLPPLLGTNGVWFVVPLSQVGACVISLLAKREVDRTCFLHQGDKRVIKG